MDSQTYSAAPPMAIAQQQAPYETIAMTQNGATPDQAQEDEQGQLKRMRGGCIPCPDGSCCYIIPIPCCC